MQRYFDRNHAHQGQDVDGSDYMPAAKIGDVAGGNFTEIETDGTMIARGNATCYNDINTAVSTGRVSQANAPAWTSFVSPVSLYTFAVNDYIQIAPFEMLHDWVEGTEIEIHLHWATNGLEGSAKYVKWQVEYTFANMTGGSPTAFGATTPYSAETMIPANTPDRTAMYTSIRSFTPSTSLIGMLLVVMLKRITASGTAPAANPFAVQLGIHYQIDTLGSRQRTTK